MVPLLLEPVIRIAKTKYKAAENTVHNVENVRAHRQQHHCKNNNDDTNYPDAMQLVLSSVLFMFGQNIWMTPGDGGSLWGPYTTACVERRSVCKVHF